MTTPPRQSKLDEILEKLVRLIWLSNNDGELITQYRNKAKTALQKIMLDSFLELLETPEGHVSDELCCDQCELRNQLRQAAEERFK